VRLTGFFLVFFLGFWSGWLGIRIRLPPGANSHISRSPEKARLWPRGSGKRDSTQPHDTNVHHWLSGAKASNSLVHNRRYRLWTPNCLPLPPPALHVQCARVIPRRWTLAGQVRTLPRPLTHKVAQVDGINPILNLHASKWRKMQNIAVIPKSLIFPMTAWHIYVRPNIYTSVKIFLF